jgi:Putative zinc finger motif, C2HC5-type
LEQLFGKDKNTQSLIEEIGRVQRGEMPLNVVETTTSITSTKKAPSSQTSTTPSTVASSSNSKKQASATMGPPKQTAKTNRPTKTTKNQAWPRAPGKPASAGPQQPPPVLKKQTTITNNKQNKRISIAAAAATDQKIAPPTPSGPAAVNESSVASSNAIEQEVVVAPPQHGKPDVVCGCFGNHHKPLANCLYCGRISCEREGYSFCAFCGYLVEKVEWTRYVVPTTTLQFVRRINKIYIIVWRSENDKAWKHKERLLRYDRESAQRTVIIDDQADYYSKSAWLTTAEEEMGQIHYDETHRQGRSMKLNIG